MRACGTCCRPAGCTCSAARTARTCASRRARCAPTVEATVRSGCPDGRGDGAEWVPLSGRGGVLSWVVFRRQYFDGIEPPHVVVAGELAEGPIVLADFDGDTSALALDLPIELVVAPAEFEDGITCPLYRWSASTDAT